MRVPLYPDPPHLSVTVYPDRVPSEEAFAVMCRVVRQAGGVPIRDVRVLPRTETFDAISDSDRVRDELRVSERRFDDLEAGRDPVLRAVAAGFTAEPVGLVVVGYSRRAPGDRRPVTALAHAKGLDIPDELSLPGQRRTGERTGIWARELLRAATSALAPLYGMLDIEATMPTPSLLARYRGWLGDLFVSARLLAATPGLEPGLRECFAEGDVETWDTGLYLSGWAPFNSSGRSVPDPSAVRRRAEALLAEAFALPPSPP